MTFPQSDSSRNQDDVKLHISAPSKVVVPKKKRGAYTLIKFVIRITNQTSQAIRFNLYNTLTPELLNNDGQAQLGIYFRYRLQQPRQEDFPLVLSGKHTDSSIIGTVTWQTKPFWKRRIFEKKYKQLGLRIEAGDGGLWSLRDLDIGTHEIRFHHQNRSMSFDIYNGSRNSIGQVTNLWIGEVSTPFTNFNLAID